MWDTKVEKNRLRASDIRFNAFSTNYCGWLLFESNIIEIQLMKKFNLFIDISLNLEVLHETNLV